MGGGRTGIPEPNPNPFGMGLGFILHPQLNLGQGTRIVWGFGGGKNRPRTAPVAMPSL